MLDGRVLRSYVPAFIERGHVIAPIEPFVTSVADRIGYSGGMLVVTRGDRFAQIPVLVRLPPLDLVQTYVEIAPILRTLGERVCYDARRHVLIVTSPRRPLATPTPFNPAVPRSPPAVVFTPEPVPTPRPVFSGPPIPRRTPVPAEAATPAP